MKIYRKRVLDMESLEWIPELEDSFEYDGPLALAGGGASSAQTQLQQSESNFYATLTADYKTVFADQEASFAALNRAIEPVLSAGPNQEGFNAAESANLNTEAINATGGNYANAARAVNNQLAGRGGNSGLKSGVDQQIDASIASQAAGQLSSEESQILQANYQTGLQNYNEALSAEEGLSAQQNPIGYAGQANVANQNAFNEATTINQENNQGLASLVGGITGIATAGIGGLTGVGGLFGANPAQTSQLTPAQATLIYP